MMSSSALSSLYALVSFSSGHTISDAPSQNLLINLSIIRQHSKLDRSHDIALGSAWLAANEALKRGWQKAGPLELCFNNLGECDANTCGSAPGAVINTRFTIRSKSKPACLLNHAARSLQA